jgi:hypothetical protein
MKPPPYARFTSSSSFTRTFALDAAELRVRRGAEVVGVDAQGTQRLQRRPQIEDVAGGTGLAIPLVHDDVVPGLECSQGGGHAGGAGAEHGHSAPEDVGLRKARLRADQEALADEARWCGWRPQT